MAKAPEAAAQAGEGDAVIGWTLDRAEREALLGRFPPRYAKAVADHVTLQARVSPDAQLPEEQDCEIVGHADDGEGVEAMVVRIGGTTHRPDGSTYHITWSLAEGRQARESNDVIAAEGWVAFHRRVAITIAPARIR